MRNLLMIGAFAGGAQCLILAVMGDLTTASTIDHQQQVLVDHGVPKSLAQLLANKLAVSVNTRTSRWSAEDAKVDPPEAAYSFWAGGLKRPYPTRVGDRTNVDSVTFDDGSHYTDDAYNHGNVRYFAAAGEQEWLAAAGWAERQPGSGYYWPKAEL
mmetsp:Transcript_3743/g.7424  ORF Transcript_3743/g.7424 Transcript_3743/m.7424 type:complete len:156 (+) Transcript_3743:39-506(+)